MGVRLGDVVERFSQGTNHGRPSVVIVQMGGHRGMDRAENVPAHHTTHDDGQRHELPPRLPHQLRLPALCRREKDMERHRRRRPRLLPHAETLRIRHRHVQVPHHQKPPRVLPIPAAASHPPLAHERNVQRQRRQRRARSREFAVVVPRRVATGYGPRGGGARVRRGGDGVESEEDARALLGRQADAAVEAHSRLGVGTVRQGAESTAVGVRSDGEGAGGGGGHGSEVYESGKVGDDWICR
mmetsp:Transcript_38772/g.81211  ORF Transcript_38772/g.81211 Transcript_38772/m.81211 type:complete len:241 (+) Transcript_38772:1169-1891(+)